MGRYITLLLISFLLGMTTDVDGAQSLQTYNVDTTKITVSGISSGGALATTFHFAHSSEISGCGIFASVPYMCGFGGLAAATTCMTTPNLVNVPFLISEANTLALNGDIDSTSNIAGSNVFVFHGTEDTVVRPGSGQNVEQMYRHYGANVETKFDLAAHHGQPTDNYGAPCESSSANSAYINNCGYQGAYEMLNSVYGNTLSRPSAGTAPRGQFIEFDQSEFFTFHPSLSSMATSGYVYIPSGCQSGITRCRLHIAFHGCAQNAGAVGDLYATKTGYMEAGELNNIIVLFPQTTVIAANLQGCWDWFGYLNSYFPTKAGNQVLATYRMMNRITRG